MVVSPNTDDPAKKVEENTGDIKTVRSIPWGRAFLIAGLVTLASFFTYHLPDNLPDFDQDNTPDFNLIADAEVNYDFFRFIGGTYLGALLALVGGSELVKKFEKKD